MEQIGIFDASVLDYLSHAIGDKSFIQRIQYHRIDQNH